MTHIETDANDIIDIISIINSIDSVDSIDSNNELTKLSIKYLFNGDRETSYSSLIDKFVAHPLESMRLEPRIFKQRKFISVIPTRIPTAESSISSQMIALRKLIEKEFKVLKPADPMGLTLEEETLIESVIYCGSSPKRKCIEMNGCSEFVNKRK